MAAEPETVEEMQPETMGLRSSQPGVGIYVP